MERKNRQKRQSAKRLKDEKDQLISNLQGEVGTLQARLAALTHENDEQRRLLAQPARCGLAGTARAPRGLNIPSVLAGSRAERPAPSSRRRRGAAVACAPRARQRALSPLDGAGARARRISGNPAERVRTLAGKQEGRA